MRDGWIEGEKAWRGGERRREGRDEWRGGDETTAADGGGDWDDEGRARAGVKSDWRGHGLRQRHQPAAAQCHVCRACMYGMESNIG